jgi:hypothetical protein
MREWDLNLHAAKLVEAQSQGFNPRDNHEELMGIIGLRRCLKEVEVERVAEVGRLAILVRDVSKVPVDLGMPPIPGIPQDSRTADNILEAAGTILECLREAYTSGHSPGPVTAILSIVRIRVGRDPATPNMPSPRSPIAVSWGPNT